MVSARSALSDGASQAYLRAVVGVLLGTLLLGEHLPAVVLAGAVTAIAGVVLINLPARKPLPLSPAAVPKARKSP